MKSARFVFVLVFAFLLVGALTLSAEDAPRKVKDQVQPVYPEMAKSMNITGVVRLEVSVAANGSVKSAKVLGGHPLLAEAAKSAVLRWKYEPGPDETRIVAVDFKH